MSGRSRATPRPRKSTQRKARGRWLALVPAVGVTELLLHLWFAGRAPRFDEYSAVIPALDGLRGGEGDLVVMAPAWAEPALRRAAGDARMPISDVARPDEEGHRHAVEVAILGARSEAHGGWREIERREVGPFVLRRLENPHWAETLFDFVDHVHDEINAVAVPAGPCDASFETPSAGGLFGHPTFPARRWVCPSGPFVHASVTVIADERFRPRRCIWAHPPPQGELTITYRRVPLGDRIIGHGGLYWMIERERRGTPVDLRVVVDGDEVGRHRHADGDGWSPFTLPLGTHAGAEAAEVTFAVSSADWRHRHFCFEARTR